MVTATPRRKRATQRYLEEKSGKRNVDGRFQVQLEERQRRTKLD